jgi:hypothetical protein
MPIVSKELINLGQQADGTFRVREEHTDTLRQFAIDNSFPEIPPPHKFQYRAPFLVPQDPPDGTSATEIMNARDLTLQLRDRDFQDIRNHVAQGFDNNPGTFEYTTPLRDITELEAEDEIATHFAEEVGDQAAPFAWWIQNLNVPQWNTIRDRIGYSVADGNAIRSRATVIITAAPEYNLLIDDPR